MISILRLVGTVNAAVWLGSAVFLTAAVGPAFFSDEMLGLMPKYHAGKAAQLILARYFTLQLVCGGVALVHLLAEWFYAGRAPSRWRGGVLAAVLGLSVLGGLWMQPKLQRLHAVMYAPNATETQKAEAKRSFGMWHGISQSANLLLTLGVLLHFWQVTNPANRGPRLGLTQV